MTNYYKGQKVRYLNQVGGGVIKSITGNTALVEDEHGFEMPFELTNLVPANREEMIAVKQDFGTSSLQAKSNVDIKTKKFLSNGLYLLFAPTNNKKFEIVLVNNCGYDVCANFFTNDKNTYQFIKNVFINDSSALILDTLLETEIAKWQIICAQLLFSKKMLKVLQPSKNINKKIDGKKFFDNKNYVFTPYHPNEVFDVCLYAENMQEDDVEISESTINQFFGGKDLKPNIKTSTPNNEYLLSLDSEVDLHIEELVENFNIYTPASLLQIQLNKVRNEINKALGKKGTKITFIHGIGKGVLKSEIINLLHNTEGVKYYDATYAKYGFGATVVEVI